MDILRGHLTLTFHIEFTDENTHLYQSTCTWKISVPLLHFNLHCYWASFVVLFPCRFRCDFMNFHNSNLDLRVCLHRTTYHNSRSKYLGIYTSMYIVCFCKRCAHVENKLGTLMVADFHMEISLLFPNETHPSLASLRVTQEQKTGFDHCLFTNRNMIHFLHLVFLTGTL